MRPNVKISSIKVNSQKSHCIVQEVKLNSTWIPVPGTWNPTPTGPLDEKAEYFWRAFNEEFGKRITNKLLDPAASHSLRLPSLDDPNYQLDKYMEE